MSSAEVRALFEKGATIQEIADRFGCSVTPVKKILRALGLRRNRGRQVGKHYGSAHSSWTGGRRLRKDGYVVLWTERGEELEHRIVMERKLGRPLRAGEGVRRRNGDKADNRPENLELR